MILDDKVVGCREGETADDEQLVSSHSLRLTPANPYLDSWIRGFAKVSKSPQTANMNFAFSLAWSPVLDWAQKGGACRVSLEIWNFALHPLKAGIWQ